MVAVVAPTPAARSFASSSSAGPSPAASSPGLGNITLRQEYWKLRALHHFTVATSITMPASHNQSIRDCWALQVPILALDHEPLLNALLAFAALHLMVAGTDDADLATCRGTWLEAALRTHRQGLDVVNVSTVDGACFTSSLLNVDGFASLKDRPLEPYEPPVRWFRILMGTRTVVQAFTGIMKGNKNSVFQTLIDSYTDYINGDTLYDRNTRPASGVAYLLEDHGLDDMRDPVVAEAYRQAAVYIGWMRAGVNNEEHIMAVYRKILAFPSLVDERFSSLVEEKAPRALIMVAHLFAFGMHCRDIWTVGDTPQREVRGLCSQIPASLQHLVAWPLSVIPQKTTGHSSNAT
jgi:hypothetical protein